MTLDSQIQRIGKLNELNNDIRNQYNKYTIVKAELHKDYLDYSGNYLDYIDRKSTVKDAVKEDTQIMILQQNNSYIMGILTLATVFITTYLVIKK
jgi:hypothetical protein